MKFVVPNKDKKHLDYVKSYLIKQRESNWIPSLGISGNESSLQEAYAIEFSRSAFAHNL